MTHEPECPRNTYNSTESCVCTYLRAASQRGQEELLIAQRPILAELLAAAHETRMDWSDFDGRSNLRFIESIVEQLRFAARGGTERVPDCGHHPKWKTEGHCCICNYCEIGKHRNTREDLGGAE